MQNLPRQPLYRVTFHQQDVWEGYTGSPADTLDVEVYQAWLEPASQQDLDHQQQHRHALHDHEHTHDHEHKAGHAAEHSHAGHGHQHGDPQVIDHGDHTHEARSVVEQSAINLEGAAEQERSRLSNALVKVSQNRAKLLVECCTCKTWCKILAQLPNHSAGYANKLCAPINLECSHRCS